MYLTSSDAVPVLRDGRVLGAIGVSGAKSEEDEEMAKAGVAALQQWRGLTMIVSICGSQSSDEKTARQTAKARCCYRPVVF